MAVPCVGRGPCGGADYIGGCGRAILGPKAAQCTESPRYGRDCCVIVVNVQGVRLKYGRERRTNRGPIVPKSRQS